MRPLVALAALTSVAVLAGCGGKQEANPEQEVRGVLTTFAAATERRDWGTLCDRVFAPGLLRGLREIGLPCEVAMRNSLGRVREPRLTVGAVTVKGRTATAEVRTSARGEAPSSDLLRLDRIKGDWKISALGARGRAGAPASP